MKKNLFIIIFLVFACLLLSQDYKIIDSKSNKEISLKEMIGKLKDYDVIFFGELHGNEVLHSLEYDLLKMIRENIDKNVIVSMEMFERDVQDILDKYLNDEITEEEFLANSRPWPNYQSDYKPLIEYAKENNLQVIAANVPRRYAAMITKMGITALDSIPEDEKRFIAKKHKVFPDEYKTKFIETMKQNMAHASKMPMGKEMNFELFYAAQCLKDDTMAESILKYQRIPPRKKVIHFNGDFHSRYHLGTAQKIQIMEPMLKVAVITPILCDTNFNWNSEHRKAGDFLILLNE